MNVQPRTIKTRAKLLAAAQSVIDETGYGDMRVEEVVKRAGVAKGTFFAHFKDKDALMDRLIGARLHEGLDQLEAVDPPATTAELVQLLLPHLEFMVSERYVFDVILRLSGAAAVDNIGPIAEAFYRFESVISPWLADGGAQGTFRRDAPPDVLAEGVAAFLMNTLATHFCAIQNTGPVAERLIPFLRLWLEPTAAALPPA